MNVTVKQIQPDFNPGVKLLSGLSRHRHDDRYRNSSSGRPGRQR